MAGSSEGSQAAPIMPQSQSKLLLLPGELRNKIYDYVFDDGKAANLDFLLTCRMVRAEAGAIAFSTITYYIVFPRLANSRELEKEFAMWEAIPLAQRNAVQSIIFRDDLPGVLIPYDRHYFVPKICLPCGFSPVVVTIVQQGYFECQAAMKALKAEVASRACTRTLFGQWLEYSHLESVRWFLREYDHRDFQIMVTRETAVSKEVESQVKSALPRTASDSWVDSARSAGLQFKTIEDHYANSFVLSAQQMLPDGEVVKGSVKLRVTAESDL